MSILSSFPFFNYSFHSFIPLILGVFTLFLATFHSPSTQFPPHRSKWDEVSYFSMRDATMKNHKALSKLVAEFESKVLQVPTVDVLLSVSQEVSETGEASVPLVEAEMVDDAVTADNADDADVVVIAGNVGGAEVGKCLETVSIP